MISLNKVAAGYGAEDVISDISLQEQGGSLAIIGPNGCGKTTLLRVIANLLPFKGDIEIDGKSVRKMNNKEISLKIALMSQISSVYFSYSVFETVMMGRYLHIKDRLLGIPSREDKDYVMHCLEAVGLADEKDKGIMRLSGGQLQRVYLARTLAQQPEIILLDEPTNHLDLKYQIELVEYLKEWAEQDGHTVIGVLHDINLAIRLSDSLMVMKNGGIKAYGKADDIFSDGLLESVYEIDVARFMRESLGIWEKLGG